MCVLKSIHRRIVFDQNSGKHRQSMPFVGSRFEAQIFRTIVEWSATHSISLGCMSTGIFVCQITDNLMKTPWTHITTSQQIHLEREKRNFFIDFSKWHTWDKHLSKVLFNWEKPLLCGKNRARTELFPIALGASTLDASNWKWNGNKWWNFHEKKATTIPIHVAVWCEL